MESKKQNKKQTHKNIDQKDGYQKGGGGGWVKRKRAIQSIIS